MILLLLTLTLFLTHKVEGVTCVSMMASCALNPTCKALYRSYYMDCKEVFLEGQACNRQCKESFSELRDFPSMKGFITECSCENDNEGTKDMCEKQKCRLMRECLEEDCTGRMNREQDQSTKFLPTAAPISASTDQSITMSSSTVSLARMNCEAIRTTCNEDRQCATLLRSQRDSCQDFEMTGGGSGHCSTQCTEGNQALIENDIGKHFQNCKFEGVDRISGRNDMLFSTLIKTCIEEPKQYQTQSPSFTEAQTRYTGDCKVQWEKCRQHKECRESFKNVIDECSNKTNCTSECKGAVRNLTSLGNGNLLWTCRCNNPRHVSRNCESIRATFADINCGSNTFTTEDMSYPTTGATVPVKQTTAVRHFYRVNYTCDERILVRIEYSGEVNQPTITAEDKRCLAHVKAGAMELELGYTQGKCGTVREVQPDKHVRYKNRIYVRSIVAQTGYDYNEIGDVDCPAKDDIKSTTAAQLQMRFYIDDNFSTPFFKDNEGVMDLGSNQTVFVQLTDETYSRDVLLRSCYATPNGQPNYESRYFLLEDGCSRDKTLTVQRTGPGPRVQFSFFRMQFRDREFNGQVYIHCDVSLCPRADPACKPGCKQPLPSIYPTKSVSYGPYYYNSRGHRASGFLSILSLLFWISALR